jgi:hypothetical protein
VAGTQQNDNYYSIAKYWINNFDQNIEFTSGSWAQSNAVVVNGKDTYVLGGDGCADYGCINTPKLWKNNSSNVVALNDGTKNATALCLGFSGSIAYAGGYEFNEYGKRVATCWIIDGNSVTPLSLTDGTNDSMIKALAIVGDDIFLAGYETDNSTGNEVAKYWRVYKGAVLPVTLQLGYGQDTEASGIFVQ